MRPPHCTLNTPARLVCRLLPALLSTNLRMMRPLFSI